MRHSSLRAKVLPSLGVVPREVVMSRREEDALRFVAGLAVVGAIVMVAAVVALV
jgi:hypothetical protein